MSNLFSLKYYLKSAFRKPDVRVRVSKGILKDQIRLGLFRKSLLENMDEKEIHESINHGLLIEEQIKINGTVRSVYVYTQHDCEQTSFVKKIFSKIQNYFELIKAICFKNFS